MLIAAVYSRFSMTKVYEDKKASAALNIEPRLSFSSGGIFGHEIYFCAELEHFLVLLRHILRSYGTAACRLNVMLSKICISSPEVICNAKQFDNRDGLGVSS